MTRPTLGWTDLHGPVLVLVALMGAASAAAQLEDSGVAAELAVTAVITAAVGMLLDAYGGTLVGLVAAASFIAVRQLQLNWDGSQVVLVGVEVLALIGAGTVAGALGGTFRHRVAAASSGATTFGSSSLVSRDVAVARLEEELLRARAHDRPLSVAVLSAHFKGGATESETRANVLRAVTRVVEHRAARTDVAFAVWPDRVGLIMPETDESAAWDRIAKIIDGVEGTSFAGRVDRTRTRISEVADVAVGVQQAGNGDAEFLIALAEEQSQQASQGGSTT